VYPITLHRLLEIEPKILTKYYYLKKVTKMDFFSISITVKSLGIFSKSLPHHSKIAFI
jgi:hypothetical protein